MGMDLAKGLVKAIAARFLCRCAHHGLVAGHFVVSREILAETNKLIKPRLFFRGRVSGSRLYESIDFLQAFCYGFFLSRRICRFYVCLCGGSGVKRLDV